MTDTHPAAMTATAFGRDLMAELATQPGICDYKRIDGHDAGQAADFGEQRRAGGMVFGPAASRSLAELRMAYVRWALAGGFTFVIGPQTAERIMKRLERDDVPTEPVPPAYISFPTPMVEYAEGNLLRGAYLSRGLVGRIVMLDGEDVSGKDAITVVTPSIFEKAHVAILEQSLRMHGGVGPVSDAAMRLARQMTGDGDPAMLSAVAAHLDGMSRGVGGPFDEQGSRRKNAQGKGKALPPATVDISEMLVERHLGRLVGKPSAHLAQAARIVLIAADEARRQHAEYGRARFLNDSQTSRNWMEAGTELKRQSAPIELA